MFLIQVWQGGKAENVSIAVCRMLVTSGLDFDTLLEDIKKEGPDKVRLRFYLRWSKCRLLALFIGQVILYRISFLPGCPVFLFFFRVLK